MAASRNGELAGDRGEDALDLIAEPDQHRNGDDGNKSQNQGVFNQRLAFLVLFLAERLFHKGVLHLMT